MANQTNGKISERSDIDGAMDQRVQAAMRALDGAIAPEAFELGAASVMTRLDEAKTLSTLPDLETSMTNETNSSVPTPISLDVTPVPMRAVVPVGAKPVAANKPTEDSGLHDLKSLAASAKNRITTRRSTTPPVDDDALLSAASASFRAMALPEPARIVSLPNPGLVPALARTPKATQSEIAVINATPAAATFAPTAKAANKNTLYIGGGVAVLAAAAAAFFVISNKGGSKAATSASAPVAIAAAAPAEATALKAAVVANDMPTVAAEANAPSASPPPVAAATAGTGGNASLDSSSRGERAKPDAVVAKNANRNEVTGGVVATKSPDPKTAAAAPVKTEGDAGSVDDLLKEAGVNVAVKEAKPTLEKKELTRDDIASVMKGRTGSAQACLGKTGVSGTVGVKLSVAPSGKVTKATATGPLAGTPTGDCVVNAVNGATFPAWDGRPTTVIYSYLLSE